MIAVKRDQIQKLSKDEMIAFVKTANENKVSDAAISIINKKKLDPDSAATIKNLL